MDSGGSAFRPDRKKIKTFLYDFQGGNTAGAHGVGPAPTVCEGEKGNPRAASLGYICLGKREMRNKGREQGAGLTWAV